MMFKPLYHNTFMDEPKDCVMINDNKYFKIIFNSLTNFLFEKDLYYSNVETELFSYRAYYWGDCSCGLDEEYKNCNAEDAEEIFANRYHSLDCKIAIPNFVYKPTGYSIWWYKHPLRAAYANADVIDIAFQAMIAASVISLDTELYNTNNLLKISIDQDILKSMYDDYL